MNGSSCVLCLAMARVVRGCTTYIHFDRNTQFVGISEATFLGNIALDMCGAKFDTCV